MARITPCGHNLRSETDVWHHFCRSRMGEGPMVRLMLVASALAIVVSMAPAHAGANSGEGDFMSRHYPPEALKKGAEGKVGFRVNASEEGRVEQCQITESSGYPALDRETCDFIVQYGKFGSLKDADGKLQPSTKMGKVNWTLPAGVPKTTVAKLVSATLPEPLLCKRGTAAGS